MQQRLNYLFYKYINDIADSDELDEFFKILDQGDHDKLLGELMDETFSPVEDDETPVEFEYYPAGADHRMLENIFKAGVETTSTIKPVRSLKLWVKLAIAAAVATIILSVGMWFLKKQDKTTSVALTAEMDVAPGKQGATLTLANGKKIRLSDTSTGVLATEAGIMITKTNNGKLAYKTNSSSQEDTKQHFNTLSTAKGETYQLQLPDGSVVWLNAASSLIYSANLTEGGKRRVKLEGEGYFEVTKNKQYPFIVESRGQEVEVLGTHFNVNNYDSDTKTTLVEGSVRISADKKHAVLKPGEQSSFSSQNGIIVSTVDPYTAIAWTQGYFYFKHEGIVTIMNRLAEWYDIEVVYEGKVTEEKFRGNISRNLRLSAILNMLSYSNSVHFRVEGRRVTVME